MTFCSVGDVEEVEWLEAHFVRGDVSILGIGSHFDARMRLLVGHVERCRRHESIDRALVVDELRGGGISGLGCSVGVEAAFLRERRAVVDHPAHGIASAHVHQTHRLYACRGVILDGTGYLARLRTGGDGCLEHLARAEIHVAVEQ